ncbi:MAG: hypothetical protein QOE03_3004 [Micromonosporaceae bacterium]|jgi:hypothetical protein|nr:hypothetical protein [Micromonosporaceae bacterium]
MDDLVTWLHQQLDEDGRAAGHAQPGPWHIGKAVDPTRPCTIRTFPAAGDVADRIRWVDAEHIARHYPARVLREVEAKRRAIDLHGIVWREIGWLQREGDELVEADGQLPVCAICVPAYASFFATRADVPVGPCVTVRLLAVAYADRPGYREEWQP